MNPEQESGTPRANAKMFTLSIHMGEEFEGYKVVPWAVARDLERELEVANARAARLELALKGVIAVADRQTAEFDEAKAALRNA